MEQKVYIKYRGLSEENRRRLSRAVSMLSINGIVVFIEDMESEDHPQECCAGCVKVAGDDSDSTF